MLTGSASGVKEEKWQYGFFAGHWLFSPGAASVYQSVNPREVKPPTGEPDAGNPHVRFGGGRGRDQPALPTPIEGNAFENE